VHPSKQLPPRLKIPDSDIIENFLKGTGPGGQKINKTSSAVQLIHKPTGIVIKCQETRSRSQNRKLARKILGERVEEHLLGENSRTEIKKKAAARKKQSAEKKKKRKYRKLEAAKAAGGEGVEEEAAEVDVDEELEPRAVEGAREAIENVDDVKAGPATG
jgi:protein subunit release factor B